MGLKSTRRAKVNPDSGIPIQRLEETKVALRELGLSDTIESSDTKK